MNPEAFLEQTRAWVEAALDRWLPPAGEEPRRLHEAMRYAIFAGGKRLRPAVARAAGRCFKGSDERTAPVACALEMLHTYSLIHDDLPALDDDDLRRGRPTCHREFGEATAILAGDALQTGAFLLLSTQPPDPATACRLVRELAEAAGTRGMVGGEIADIEAEGEPPDRARVEFIHERKTAALFRASAAMGAIAAGAPESDVARLREYGTALGLAFQIVDDVLDETSDAATLGKSPGKDRRSGKMSYPAVAGLEESRAQARHWVERACASVAGLEGGELLAGLAGFTATRIR